MWLSSSLSLTYRSVGKSIRKFFHIHLDYKTRVVQCTTYCYMHSVYELFDGIKDGAIIDYDNHDLLLP